VQTVWGPLFRRTRLGARRERIATRDGDFVDLDWVEPSGSRENTGATGAPLLLVLHGLEGSSQSHYAVGLMRGAAARGWRAVTLNFRSCSGELNRRPQFYHSGHTDDLDDVVRRVLEREPETRLVAAGVSLGGNVLLKWLGEREVSAPEQLAGVVAISVPFDLAPCARALDTGLRRPVYAANFLSTMREKVRQKAQRDPGFAAQVDLPRALKARTFAEYDRAVTAPLNGFADERDYWIRASSGPYLPRIRRPTLLINALDDPIVPPEALPDPRALSPWISAEFVERGGHAGFIEGPWPWRVGSWAERRALEFLGAVLAGAGPAC
jgi:predicted alpha/beta-fold hydrolase